MIETFHLQYTDIFIVNLNNKITVLIQEIL